MSRPNAGHHERAALPGFENERIEPNLECCQSEGAPDDEKQEPSISFVRLTVRRKGGE